jgi:hypothetical protein
MAQRIRKVQYFSMATPNKAGEGARILGMLRDAGVNLLAYTGFPDGRKAQMDFVPTDSGRLRRAAKRLKLRLSAGKTGFLVQGDDRRGAVADVMARLAKARINVTAIDAVCAGKGRYGAILWVKPRDVRSAAKTLRAS